MELIADILMVAGSFGAAIYCYVLSARLKKFTTLETGMGGAIAVLSAQVDDMTARAGKGAGCRERLGRKSGDADRTGRDGGARGWNCWWPRCMICRSPRPKPRPAPRPRPAEDERRLRFVRRRAGRAMRWRPQNDRRRAGARGALIILALLFAVLRGLAVGRRDWQRACRSPRLRPTDAGRRAAGLLPSRRCALAEALPLREARGLRRAKAASPNARRRLALADTAITAADGRNAGRRGRAAGHARHGGRRGRGRSRATDGGL